MSAPAGRPSVARFALLGDPIAHSLSPAMHRAAYAALGLPHTYEAVRVGAAGVPAELAQLRSGGYAGLNITAPHKQRALELADVVHPVAARAGAANTLVRAADGRVHAHNTDAPALADELRALAPERGAVWGGTAVVLGAGGAARAAIVALAGLGVARVVVRARRLAEPAAAARFEGELGAALADLPVSLLARGLVADSALDADALAVVQATSAGMVGADPGDALVLAVAWHALPRACVALDLVYTPKRTPFLDAAEGHGRRATNGLGMLVGQGARAIELWLEVAAPRAVMRAALPPST